jgi:hypothetical protein
MWVLGSCVLSLILTFFLIKGRGLLFPRKSYMGTSSRKMTALTGQNSDIKYLVLSVNKKCREAYNLMECDVV